jgi:hypothetical protein
MADPPGAGIPTTQAPNLHLGAGFPLLLRGTHEFNQPRISPPGPLVEIFFAISTPGELHGASSTKTYLFVFSVGVVANIHTLTLVGIRPTRSELRRTRHYSPLSRDFFGNKKPPKKTLPLMVYIFFGGPSSPYDLCIVAHKFNKKQEYLKIGEAL